MRFGIYKKINLGKHLSMNVGTKGVTFGAKIGKANIYSNGGLFYRIGRNFGFRGRWK